MTRPAASASANPARAWDALRYWAAGVSGLFSGGCLAFALLHLS